MEGIATETRSCSVLRSSNISLNGSKVERTSDRALSGVGQIWLCSLDHRGLSEEEFRQVFVKFLFRELLNFTFIMRKLKIL